MAMEITQDEKERTILDWDEDQVHQWLTSLGYPQYQSQIKEHKISGDALCLLDPEGLKAVGIATVGQRLSILKAVYQAKLAHRIPVEPDHYIPPSEVQERNVSVEKLFDLVKEQAQRVHLLEEDNKQLHDHIRFLLDEYNAARNRPSDEPPLRRQHSYKWAQYPAKSPTKPDAESPHLSPQQAEHDPSQIQPQTGRAQPPPQIQIQPSSTPTERHPRDSPGSNPPSSASIPPNSATSSSAPLSSSTPNSGSTSTSKPTRTDSTDNLKSFKVSLEDPTWKVLPAALKKYKINNDNWQNYAMFICYGSPGNRIERCLSYDEKPLLLFQKLKDAKKNPVFMLKHIKDIRSPIAVAQQKHALRKASVSNQSSASQGHPSQSHSTQSHHPSASYSHSNAHHPSSSQSHANLHPNSSSHPNARPPKLDVSSPRLDTQQPLTGTTPQAGWPEVMSPTLEREGSASSNPLAHGSTSTLSHASTSTLVQDTGSMRSTSTLVHGSTENGGTGGSVKSRAGDGEGTKREMPPPMAGVSYAVAIYPYMAEQEDEFDVVVGDTFVILSRARGWWVVQRDPTGSGVVDTDTSKQGWVPAGCLLETNVPVASAIAEATAASSSTSVGPSSSAEAGSTDASPGTQKKTPILPLSIISTSFPGIALMEYKKKGEEELDLAKDDALRVFKRYNHWSYAVKEEGGDRGWVPSWFIGKVPTPGAAPPTPALPNVVSVSLDQVSPMSSAFPLGRTL
ncbi:hypothetical protein BV22DRAFT_1102687 [Leucogyrophana mollusca]|uniref:Uncharacterized protein n=1 Tax=Leucogyrophana mollusca TaxID=85980 RepID=A0ACB8BWX8_9AGAM|nr:hypothetical protein BV22DRAFT_1102687 [Leucogyrophana mollusca]